VALRELMAHDNKFTTMPPEMCKLQVRFDR
jgi:hypothetical protein